MHDEGARRSSALSTDGQRVRAHFADGVLWGGLGTSPDPAAILNRWVEGIIDLSDLPTLPQRVARLSGALAGRKLLLVLAGAG